MPMTEERISLSLPGLRRSLGLGEETDELLRDALCAAEEEILRYLNRTDLPTAAECLLVELAALKYCARGGTTVKKSAYGEGQLTQSEEYFTPEELREGTRALLETLAPYRRVRCGRCGDGAA